MGTFLLVLVLLVGGQHHEFIVDRDMAAIDCAQAIEASPPGLREAMSCELQRS